MSANAVCDLLITQLFALAQELFDPREEWRRVFLGLPQNLVRQAKLGCF